MTIATVATISDCSLATHPDVSNDLFVWCGDREGHGWRCSQAPELAWPQPSRWGWSHGGCGHHAKTVAMEVATTTMGPQPRRLRPSRWVRNHKLCNFGSWRRSPSSVVALLRWDLSGFDNSKTNLRRLCYQCCNIRNIQSVKRTI